MSPMASHGYTPVELKLSLSSQPSLADRRQAANIILVPLRTFIHFMWHLVRL